MKLINKVYLSSSKASSPVDYMMVHDALENGVKCQIKQFTGGTYDVTHPDECDIVILVPPTKNVGLANHCAVGRGQYDMACRALNRKQHVIVFVNNSVFKEVRNKRLTEVNWTDNYGILEYVDTRTSETLQYELKLRKKGIKKETLPKEKPASNNDLLTVTILFPEQFNF